ncbi:MAG: B12-binding domain-containing radical SAM protein [Sedimentisphaerales bacterium]|nr:B12-binding domain-containing radical SAM protein [Sedimentisphaerales bacterium]
MLSNRKVRFVEPQGRPERPLNAWITRWPLLGPITLATILEQQNCDVLIYNENISGPLQSDPQIWQDLETADVIGISIMTSTARRGYELADQIKQAMPNVTVVIGGVHATFCPDEAIEHADIVVRGEAENIIVDIAAGQVEPGIVQPEPPQDLDAIPTLNHFLVHEFDKLVKSCRKRELYELPVMASRGCPHACTYCTVTQMFGRKVRRQSVEKVHEDLKVYASRGFRYMFFYDDNFTASRSWAKELCQRITPMNLMFNIQVRVDLHWTNSKRNERDNELLQALQDAGCTGLYVGYETIDDETAKQWHKGYQGENTLVSRLQEDTKILHEYNFWIHAMFVMGPQQDAQTAENIVKFAKNCNIQTLQITVLTPYPGTEMFDEMKPHLLLNDFPNDWDWYDACHVTYTHGRMEIEDFQNVVFQAHKKFYRGGGWDPLTLKLLLKRPITLWDKINEVIIGLRAVKTIMKKWSKDNQQFCEFVKERQQQRFARRAGDKEKTTPQKPVPETVSL